MLTPFTIRFARTCCATGNIALMSATGKPAFSSSLLITAPLRLHVPHVATKSTPSTPSFFKSAAISWPMRRITVGEPWFPGIT